MHVLHKVLYNLRRSQSDQSPSNDWFVHLWHEDDCPILWINNESHSASPIFWSALKFVSAKGMLVKEAGVFHVFVSRDWFGELCFMERYCCVGCVVCQFHRTWAVLRYNRTLPAVTVWSMSFSKNAIHICAPKSIKEVALDGLFY